MPCLYNDTRDIRDVIWVILIDSNVSFDLIDPIDSIVLICDRRDLLSAVSE